MRIAPKGVGQDDVGPGIDKTLMQCLHALGMIEVPELGWFARSEAAFEVVGASRSISEKDPVSSKQRVE